MNEKQRRLAELKAGCTKPVGVGLKEGEIALLDKIADKLNVKRNQILHHAVRRFLSDVIEGSVTIRGQSLDECLGGAPLPDSWNQYELFTKGTAR